MTVTVSHCSYQDRKAVVISARVHPGESCSSYMMEGVLDFLVSSSMEAKVSMAKLLQTVNVYFSVVKNF